MKAGNAEKYPSDAQKGIHLRRTPERDRKLQAIRRSLSPVRPELVAIAQVLDHAIDVAYDRLPPQAR